MTPTFIMPKLYANDVYMVLNSRFKIIGGRDTYKSSTNISIMTTMIRNITYQSTDETHPTDRTQGQVPVVLISSEVFNNNHEIGQMNVSRGTSCGLLELNFPWNKPQDGCMIICA